MQKTRPEPKQLPLPTLFIKMSELASANSEECPGNNENTAMRI
jgi:hypothetical protein